MATRAADVSKFPKTPVLRYENGVAILPLAYFDEIVLRLDNCGYSVGDIDGWYPSMEQAKELCQNVIENYEFIFWLTESNYELAKKNKEVRDYLKNALLKSASFVDEPMPGTKQKKEKKKDD